MEQPLFHATGIRMVRSMKMLHATNVASFYTLISQIHFHFLENSYTYMYIFNVKLEPHPHQTNLISGPRFVPYINSNLSHTYFKYEKLLVIKLLNI